MPKSLMQSVVSQLQKERTRLQDVVDQYRSSFEAKITPEQVEIPDR